jgi:hypothetical protein
MQSSDVFGQDSWELVGGRSGATGCIGRLGPGDPSNANTASPRTTLARMIAAISRRDGHKLRAILRTTPGLSRLAATGKQRSRAALVLSARSVGNGERQPTAAHLARGPAPRQRGPTAVASGSSTMSSRVSAGSFASLAKGGWRLSSSGRLALGAVRLSSTGDPPAARPDPNPGAASCLSSCLSRL